MNMMELLHKKMTASFLQLVRKAAIQGAGRASSRGAYESKVPEVLQKNAGVETVNNCEKNDKKWGGYYEIEEPLMLIWVGMGG